MNYKELIKKFWKFNETQKLDYRTISLYFLLLDEWDNNGQEDFKLSDVIISKKIGLSRVSVVLLKQKLLQFGLIQYKVRNGLPCMYRIVSDFSFLQESIKQEPVRDIKVQKPKESLVHQADIVIEEKSPAIEISSPPIISVTPLIRGNTNIPTLEEFMSFAKTIEIYEKDMDFQIKVKYESWLDNNWRDGYDKPIRNWKNSLKSVMPYMNKHSFQGKIPSIKRPKSTYNE